MRHANLEIRILDLTPEGYPVEITFDGEQRFPRGYLQLDIVPWIPSASPITDGERLFNRLLADDRLKTAWAAARGQSPRRRIRLWIDAAAPGLHTIPWELLRDAGPGLMPQTLAADIDTPFSRYLADPQRPDTSIVDRPIKLLVALANPANLTDYNLPPLDIETERQLIIQAVSGLGNDQLGIKFLKPPVTLSALEDELKHGCHLLHIVGHGRFHPQRKEAVLFLANDDNQVERVSAAELAELVARQAESPRLVFLAACQTATRSPAEAFRGFAPRLIAAGVPAVVAMQDIVPIDATREFTRTFYRRLLHHGQVDLAANEGRSALLAGRDDSWAVPVLYSRVPDGVIMKPAPTVWERFLQFPIVTRILAVASVLVGVVSVIAMLVGLFVDIQAFTPTPTATATPIRPMSDKGFYIAVAQFAPGKGVVQSQAFQRDSKELSEWLFNAVEKINEKLPYSLRTDEARGPDLIGIVNSDNLAEVMKKHNPTILVYGVINVGHEGYEVQPEFSIAEEGYLYAPEITGPNRLGQPVPFELPLGDPGTLFGLNQKLDARVEALQYLILGLAELYAPDDADLLNNSAYEKFKRATTVENWQPAEGQEVVYLLMGAAKLRAATVPNTTLTDRDKALIDASDAFTEAYRLNPDYARSYLGLGGVALERAKVFNSTGKLIGIDSIKLAEASDWYSNSLRALDNPVQAYVSIKATYGQGQVHLAGYTAHLPGWSASEAQDFFTQITRKYINKNPPPEIAWFVGNAHGNLALLAESVENWQVVLDECDLANKIFKSLTDSSSGRRIAYCHDQMGLAYEKLGQFDKACIAYNKAIQKGREVGLSENELDQWEMSLNRLNQKGAC
ncbi:MAG: CHAT domain-containing protein [Anaerolineae bacterium]|nr:CHAT domain-containing protein [Anaerolineae bacterium]